MALVTLFANSTNQQVLGVNDDFVLGANVTLAVANMAIFGSSALEASLFGNVFSTNDSAFVVVAGTTPELFIGASANIAAHHLHAIEISSTSTIDVQNAGTVAATDNSAFLLKGTAADPDVDVDFRNTGSVTANGAGVDINAANGSVTFDNSGTILGKTYGAVLDSDVKTGHFNNSGTISGDLDEGVRFLGTSDVRALNSGTISSSGAEAVSFSSGVFNNTGTLASVNGNAFTASGAVTLRNSGTIFGEVDLGAGNDNYRGYFGLVEGSIHGGDGADTIIAGREDDILFGDDGIDSLYGRGGDDYIRGGNDEDYLFGNRGDDLLAGDAGKDYLRGGAGSDTFVFGDGDSGLRANADVIEDFNRRADKIDLSHMNNAVDFIGGARFSGTGSEVRLKVKRNGDTLVQIDSDGDGRADMHIIVEDASRLTEDHFIL